MKFLKSNIARVFARNRKALLALFVIAMITLACSPGSWCGGGGYIGDQARDWDIENFEDALRYWPTTRPIQWSADGSQIIFVQYSQSRYENRVYAVAPDGSNLELIVEAAYQPNISPDGERVVYTATEVHRKLPFLIETRKIDGSDRRRLAEGGGEPNYLYPAWSPDGTRIAFARDSESAEFEDTGIYTVAADGSDLRWLLRSAKWHVAGPVWSPDGKSLAFTAWPGTLRVIYDIEEDGSKLTKVYESPIREKRELMDRIVGQPAWSPDGQKLAFILESSLDDATDEPPKVSVITINADGTGQRTVVEISVSNERGGSLLWSPDGTELLFTLLPSAPRRIGEVFVANADGFGQQGVGTGNYAAWSPDGSRIAVFKNVGPGGHIVYTMTPDGSDVHNLVLRDSSNRPVLADSPN